MYIKINVADENADTVKELLAPFLNRSKVDVTRIVYSKEEKWIEIPFVRKLSYLGKSIFDKHVRITEEKESLLQIKNVEDFTIHTAEFLLTDLNGIFTVLFGMKISGHKLYLSSIEESKGRLACELNILVSSINLEITDRSF